jgi:ribosomal protein S18 acetylase RimI-like enzyme
MNYPAPQGPLRIAKVPWDSRTFGFPIYDLRCDDASAECLTEHLPGLLKRIDAAGPTLIVCKISVSAASHAEVLTRDGFYPIEAQVELYLPLARFKPVIQRWTGDFRLREATEDLRDRLVELSRTAFKADRFHVDPHLSAEKADQRFAEWVQLGMRDGEPVFVLEDTANSRLLGFFHVRPIPSQPGAIDLSLAAIDPAYQKLGVGLIMYQMTIMKCRALGYTLAETHVTLSNLDVLNLFMRLGFSIRRPMLTFHRYQAGGAAQR